MFGFPILRHLNHVEHFVSPPRTWVLTLAALAAFGLQPPVGAATLTVGPGDTYGTAEEAARAAQPGDTILLKAGTYPDCAVWRTDHLTIEGFGSGALFSGVTCQDKAIFVIQANDITIRNIKFEGARSTEGNGAGIRAQGTNLSIENSTFRNNQDGILADKNPNSSIFVRNSVFEGNGACVTLQGCAHGIYAGHIALLHVEGTRFFGTKIGHHIKSRALRTEIVDNDIEDGPDGTASYLVDIPNGGALVLTGNVFEKGPMTDNPSTAIAIGEERNLQPSSGLLIEHNRFTNDGPPTAFVWNRTAEPAQLIGNSLKGNAVTPLVGQGTVK